MTEEKKGKRCPRCGEHYERGTPSYMTWNCDDAPHENRDDCIAYLKGRLDEICERLDRHNF